MYFGDRVFRALEPIFGASICTAYQSDFHERDKQYLQRIVVPGFEFLWIVREHGTHIVPIGHDRDKSLEYLTGAAGHPDDLRSFYHVKCTSSNPLIRNVDRQSAFRIAGASTPFTLSYSPCTFSNPDHHVEIRIHDVSAGTAFIRSQPRPMDGNHYVACRAQLASCLTPVQQVLTKLLIEQTFTKVVGSLFVRIDEFLINDVPMYDWEQARTTVPVEQPALFAD